MRMHAQLRISTYQAPAIFRYFRIKVPPLPRCLIRVIVMEAGPAAIQEEMCGLRSQCPYREVSQLKLTQNPLYPRTRNGLTGSGLRFTAGRVQGCRKLIVRSLPCQPYHPEM